MTAPSTGSAAGSELVDERVWRWASSVRVDSLRFPTEAFWRGLGYAPRWNGSECLGRRELDGQQREVVVRLEQLEDGSAEVRCIVRFLGPAGTPRPNEVYQPSRLTTMFGAALAQGFGPPVD